MKAQKLPSGKYRAFADLGKDDDGKRIRKSFTAATEALAIALASDYESKHKNKVSRDSLSTALDSFISSKEAVLSPTTIKDYLNRSRTLKRQYPQLCSKSLIGITSDDLQDFISDMMHPHSYHKLTKTEKGASPKTIRNYINFLSAVFRHAGVPMPEVVLPQKERAEIYVPTVEEIKRLLDVAKDTDMYVPIALGAFGPLRRGEICALKYPDDFNGKSIHVHASMAQNKNKRWVIKAPKSFSSDRRLELLDWIVDAIEDKGYVTRLNPGEITARFEHVVKKAGLPPFRFHDLRHFCISYLHTLGVPDQYIIKRTGHSGTEILLRVYRHTMADYEQSLDDKIENGFLKITG